MKFLRRRPLFYLAAFLSAFIIISSYSPPFFKDLFIRKTKHDVSQVVSDAPKAVFLGGVVVSDVDTRPSAYGGELSGFVLEAKKLWVGAELDLKPASGKVKCYLKDARVPLQYGDEVVLKGNLALPQGLRNPGGFDKRAYLSRQGIRSVLYGDKNFDSKILRRGRGLFIYEKALTVRHFLSSKISESFKGNEAAFLKALFFGEKSDLEEDFTDLFIKTGTMHILAVSGFNIGFLCAAIFLMLNLLPIGKNTKIALSLVAVWAYCLLVGWQAPVVRASLMASIFFSGQLLGRKTDALNSMGLAACVILLLTPQAIFDVGFQLSFLAVLAMICCVPIFYNKPVLLPFERLTLKEKALTYIRELFWVSFVCVVVTLPITVQNFYLVTPLSILSNLIVVPLSFVLFFAGILFFLSAAWTHPVLSWIPFLMSGLMKLFVAALETIERIPGAYLIVGKLAWPLLLLMTVGLLYLLNTKKIASGKLRAVTILIFLTFIFLTQETTRYFHRPFRMTVLDVGQGDATFFEFPDGKNLLVDAGKGGESDKGRRVIAPYLKSKGIRHIDAMVVSHPQEDHIGGMPTLVDEFRVKNFVEAGSEYPSQLFGRLKEKINEEGAVRRVLKHGDTLGGIRGVSIQTLSPRGEATQDANINNESLVLKLVYGETSFLMTGDIEDKVMTRLLDETGDLSSTVLKVPHHGARLKAGGRAFVERAHPQVSIISVGERNPFHHPTPETLDALDSVPGNKIFRTDRDGAVEILSDGQLLDVKSLVRS